MNHHVYAYYLNKMKNVNTGDAMTDYCHVDVYFTLAMRNM